MEKQEKQVSLFTKDREWNFFQSIAREAMEDVVGQFIIYFDIDPKLNPSDIYGEDLDQVVLENGRKIFCRWEMGDQESPQVGGQETEYKEVEINIPRYTLDQMQLVIKEGRYLLLDGWFFETTTVQDNRYIHGKPEYKDTIYVEAISSQNQEIFRLQDTDYFMRGIE